MNLSVLKMFRIVPVNQTCVRLPKKESIIVTIFRATAQPRSSSGCVLAPCSPPIYMCMSVCFKVGMKHAFSVPGFISTTSSYLNLPRVTTKNKEQGRYKNMHISIYLLWFQGGREKFYNQKHILLVEILLES